VSRVRGGEEGVLQGHLRTPGQSRNPLFTDGNQITRLVPAGCPKRLDDGGAVPLA
jgi:hypothetical protein